ncbi:MAG: ABC transporter permease [Lachnospiraceae bacterium]|nr:ABC transporter permease [Lachnospiraceae bacterium]MBP5183672.1 ABC transporter permease [Lachnospiraceae bacterium]
MAQSKANKEPLVHVVRKEDTTTLKKWMLRVIAVAAALLVTGAFVFAVTGINPFNIYGAMVTGTFGTPRRIRNTIKTLTPLLCLGVGLAPAFKMKFWNIGAQGQMLVGALAASFVALTFRNLPGGVLIPLMGLGAILAGALWAVLPAIFKAFWNTNETLFTLMMNYIATFWVMYSVDVWKGESSGFASFKQIAKNAVMPVIAKENFYICTGIVLIVAALMYIYMKRTKHGYELAVVGESEKTARYAGINVKKVTIRTMVLSGAICGLCGFLTVSGIDFTLSHTMNNGFGFTAIVVAWLAKFNPFTMIGTSFMMVFFQNAASEISSMNANATEYLSNVISGIILFFLIGVEFFINYRLVFRKNGKEGK